MNEDCLESFLETIAAENGAAKNTVVSYRFDLEQFIEYFSPHSVCELSKKDLQEYSHFLNSHGYCARSVSRKLSALRDFFKFLYSEGLAEQNPTINLEAPKQEKKLPEFLSQSDVFSLIETAKNSKKFIDIRNSAMIMVMYACGLRVSELINLPISAVNFEKKIVFVKGKGSKERLVPIADEAIKHLYDYIETRELFLKNVKSLYLFPSSKSPQSPLTRDVFFKQLKDLASLAGISPNKVHPHVLRHSFATFLINHDTNLRSVQKMLGHEKITTTEIYTHILSENLKETVKKNHPLAFLGDNLNKK